MGTLGDGFAGRKAVRHAALTATTALVAASMAITAYAAERNLPPRPEQTPKWRQDAIQVAQTASASEQERAFDIPAQPLASALTAFGDQAGLQVTVDGSLPRGQNAPAVQGTMSLEQALSRLLAGSGLSYRFTGTDTVTLAKAGEQDGDGPMQLGQINVEGSAPDPLNAPGYDTNFSVAGPRSSLTLEETPRSIGVVTSDFIEDANIPGAVETLDYVSGVNFAGTFGSKPIFKIRGFDSAVFDGTRLDGLDFSSRTQSLNDAIIERVEVLKGPASVLYGGGDPGGLVNFVTKRPHRDSFIRFEGEVGSQPSGNFVLDANTPITEDGRLRGRFVAAVEKADSQTDFAEFEQQALLGALAFDPTPDTALGLRAFYQRDDNEPPAVLPLLENGEIPPGFSEDTFVGAPNINRDFFEQVGVIAEGSQEFDDLVALETKASFIRQERESISTYIGFGSGLVSGVPESGDASLNAFRTADTRNFYNGEISARLDLDKYDIPVEFLFGADYVLRDSVDVDLNTVVPLGEFNIFEPAQDFEQPDFESAQADFKETKRGIFGEVLARPIDGLTLLFGVRNDRSHFERTRFSLEGDVQDRTERTDFATTFQGGGSYEVLDGVRLYGSFSESFTPNSSTGVNEERLDPEEGKGWEGGAKLRLLDDRLQVTTAYFNITRENIAIASDTDPNISVPLGEVESQGVEFDVAGSPLDGVQVKAAYAFIDAEITEDDDDSIEGNRPGSIPKHKFSIWSGYTQPSGPYRGVGAAVGILGNTDFFLGEENDVTFDGHARANLSFFYRPPALPFEVSLDITNVTDEKFVPGTRSFKGFAFNFGQERTAFLRGKLKF